MIELYFYFKRLSKYFYLKKELSVCEYIRLVMSSMNFIAKNKQVLIGVIEIISVVKHILKITTYLLNVSTEYTNIL